VVYLESRQGEPTIVTGAKFLEELALLDNVVLNGELTMDGVPRYESNGIIASIIDICGKHGERTEKENSKKLSTFESKHGNFEEALAKIDANGNLIKPVVDKEAEKALVKQKKDAEKQQKDAEKQKKDAEKQQIVAEKALIKQQKEALVKQKAELASMKEEDILSKAAEKLVLKQQKKEEKEALVKQQKQKKEEKVEKPKKVKKIAIIEATPFIKSVTEDEEPFIRFKNIPLLNEINSIRDVKKFKNHKKLSSGVKLARQIMDI
jgi:hypothetical protein